MSRKRYRSHNPNRQETLANRRNMWNTQMPALFEAYMAYKYGPAADQNPENGDSFMIAVLGVQGKSPNNLSTYILILPYAYRL